MTDASEMVSSLKCRYGKLKQLGLYIGISKFKVPGHLAPILFYIE